MVRAAAKNFKNVTIITDINDYPKLIQELNKEKGKTSFNFRSKMAAKAFSLTAYYDQSFLIGLIIKMASNTLIEKLFWKKN